MQTAQWHRETGRREDTRRLLTVAGAAHVGLAAPCFPFNCMHEHACGHQKAASVRVGYYSVNLSNRLQETFHLLIFKEFLKIITKKILNYSISYVLNLTAP